MLPSCQLIFKCTMEEAKSAAVAPLPGYDLSRLCRVPVCGRQLSLKLVTVQPPTCQLNGLFICPRAMHYGPEQSPLIGSQFVPFPLNTYEKNCVIPAEIKCTLQSTLVLYACSHMHSLVTLSKMY